MLAALPAISHSAMSTAEIPKAKAPPRPKTCNFLWISSIKASIRVASCPMQSGPISWSTASLTDATARNPNASPHPTNPSSVVTLTRRESAAGRLLSPQAEASDRIPPLNGIRNGMESTLVMIIHEPHSWAPSRFTGPTPSSSVLMPRIVLRVVIFEAERTDCRHLRDVFARFRPMEMPGLARQNDDASRRIGFHLLGV